MSTENSKSKPPASKKTTHQNWFTRPDGKIQGPFPKGMIQSFVLSGRLKLSDEVSFDKEVWSKLKEHRELIPKELLNVKTKEDKERLRMAIRRENERLHDRRTNTTNEGAGTAGADSENRRSERRKTESESDFNRRHSREEIGRHYRQKKNQFIQILVFSLCLIALAWGAYHAYFFGNKSVISITNCSAPAMPKVNWANCKLEGHRAVAKDISSGQFSNVNLKGADLHGSNIQGANFHYANLERVNFSYADISQSRLVGARLRGADLTNADISQSDLSYSNLLEAKMGGAVLKGARFDNAIWIDGRKCRVGSIGYCR